MNSTPEDVPGEQEGQELLALSIEALSEIWGLGAEPSAAIARAALDEIEKIEERRGSS